MILSSEPSSKQTKYGSKAKLPCKTHGFERALLIARWHNPHVREDNMEEAGDDGNRYDCQKNKLEVRRQDNGPCGRLRPPAPARRGLSARPGRLSVFGRRIVVAKSVSLDRSIV